MKTKQEQIDEMAVIGCVRNPQAHTAEECAKCDFKQGKCNAYRHAEKLYSAGYGDISEYKSEREMLGSQIKVLKQRLNDKYIEIDNLNRDYSNAFERLKSQQQEIERLKAENACLLKACEEQFTFDTTQNKKYSIFNSVRKEFAERLKERFTQYNNTDDVDIVASVNYELNELLKEYEK